MSRPMTADLVIALTARFYGLRVRDILVNRHAAWPRRVARAMCLKFVPHTAARIGEAFGVDDSVIFEAQRRVRKRIAEDVEIGAEIAALENELAQAGPAHEPPASQLKDAPRSDRIIRLTAEFFRIPVEALLGRPTSKRFAHPRQVAMALTRLYTGLSLPQIGVVFDRDHTTVLFAARAVAARASADSIFMGELAILCAQIEAGEVTLAAIQPAVAPPSPLPPYHPGAEAAADRAATTVLGQRLASVLPAPCQSPTRQVTRLLPGPGAPPLLPGPGLSSRAAA